MKDRLAEQYRESQRELFAENEQLKAEIARLTAELAEAHEAGKLSFGAGVSLQRDDLLAAIASRDEEIARLKAAYDKLLATSEKAIYDCLQGR